MEKRRKYSRHFLQTMHTLLPPAFVVTQFSALLVISSLFLLVDYTESIMAFPEDSGVYSLFPDEDLKTGRKRIRFDDEPSRGGGGSYRGIEREREGREYSSSSIVRSYPMLPHDRLHRPVADYTGGGGSRQVYDNYREREGDRGDYRDRDRHGRVYFDDRFRTSRFDFHRLNPRPRPGERPVSPIVFETSRRPPPPHNLHNHHYHHSYRPDPYSSPPPAIGQSKLPVGAATRVSGEDNNVPPTRIHVFNPDSVSFGNPRNAAGGISTKSREETSAERVRHPPSNFVETGPPGPESFLNHDDFLEYQKKIAFSRFPGQDDDEPNGKKVLFESKEPFEIDGPPTPPAGKSRESNSGNLPTTSKTSTHGQSIQPSVRYDDNSSDQRGGFQRGEGQIVNNRNHPYSSPTPFNLDNVNNNGGGEERDTGGGEVESDLVKGEEVESENGKSEVRRLPPPPTQFTKSGRAHHSNGGSSVGENYSVQQNSDDGKKFTPSISHNEDGNNGGDVGRGTGFKLPLPTTAIYSFRGDDDGGAGDRDDEPPNGGLHGFVPVVPFHLIGPEQPRAVSVERQRQQQHRLAPHEHSTTARSTISAPTTIRSIPIASSTIASPTTTTSRAKVTKTVFRSSPEVFKSPSSFSVENSGNGNNHDGAISPSPTNFGSSPASPILHATAGERSNSETSNKVAITKQQELKRLQKQRQQLSSIIMHQLTNNNPASNSNDNNINANSADAEPSLPSHATSVSSSDGLFPTAVGFNDDSVDSDSSSDNNSAHNNHVTRIKGSPTSSSSKETSDKTLSAILATTTRRTSKPAVVVSTSAAGLRPRVVGSVVEAGPAWPGLVSNFLRKNNPPLPPTIPAYHPHNNRSFTATATIRPKGSSGTNSPTRPGPTMIANSGQVQKITLTPVPTAAQQKQIVLQHKHHQQPHPQQQQPTQQFQQQKVATPTQFQLEQIRHPPATAIAVPSGIGSVSSVPIKDIHGLEMRPINERTNPVTATPASLHNTRASASTKSHQHIRITNDNNFNRNDYKNESSSIISNPPNNIGISDRGGFTGFISSDRSKSITNDDHGLASVNNNNQQQHEQEENPPLPAPLPPPQFITNDNNTTTGEAGGDGQAHVTSNGGARRLYSFEESSSSAQINNNSSSGVVSLVHAHISHCPKLHSPTEVICDVHIREGHGVPNPQLTVGWRRKFYNSTLPDVLLALNKAPASGERGHFDPHHSVMEVDPTKGERLEEFHDKFNVTLAPGISPMLRSVLLIRSVTAPDCGTYQCEVDDGINVLTSETLLFLCH